jgi:hypothetical protein
MDTMKRQTLFWLSFVFLLVGGVLLHAQSVQRSVDILSVSGPLFGGLSGNWPNPTVARVNNSEVGSSCGHGLFAKSTDRGMNIQCGVSSAVLCAQNTTSFDGTGVATTDTVLAVCALPYAVMLPSASLDITAMWSFTGSANTKTMKAFFSSTAQGVNQPLTGINGTQRIALLSFGVVGSASMQTAQYNMWLATRNALNAEIGSQNVAYYSGPNTNAPSVATIPVGGYTWVALTGEVDNASEHITVERFLVRLAQ